MWEMEKGKEVLRERTGLALTTSCRKREYVNARIVYTMILYGEVNNNEIARSLKRNHSTTIHYKKVFEWYGETDPELVKLYQKAKAMYDAEMGKANSQKIMAMSRIELMDMVCSLQEEVNVLSCELKSVKDSRTERLAQLVAQRTKAGTEEMIERKLNQFYNGVYDC